MAVVLAAGFGMLALVRISVLARDDRASLPETWLKDVALAAGMGLLLFLSLVLVQGSLSRACWLAGIIGLGSALAASIRTDPEARTIAGPAQGGRAAAGTAWVRLILAAAASLVLCWLVSRRWIVDWDARSIWFFHAKMIYFDGGLPLAAYKLPDVAFSHPDYPQLIPVLGAAAAWFAGFWNEALPLLGMVPLYVAECFILVCSTSGLLAPTLLVLAISLRFPELTGFLNGYADAHVALFGLCAALLFGRWLEGDDEDAVGLGMICLGLMATLKNEGLVLACVIAGVTGVLHVWRAGWTWRRMTLAKTGVPLVVAAAPVFLWAWIKWDVQLTNDLAAADGTLARAAARLNLQDLGLILRYTGARTTAAITVLVVAMLLVARSGRKPAALLLVASSFIYSSLLFAIYVTTPYDLEWHLDTSAGRVTAAAKLLLVGAVVLLLAPAWAGMAARFRSIPKPD